MSLACDALITIMVSAVTSGCARVGAFVVVTVAVIASIVMAVEGLTPDEILKREIGTGEPVVYRIGADGKLAEKVAI